MATTQLKLSSKTDANGRSQVIVKLTITRTNRPCFKSGVFVNPDWFKIIQETKKGFVYGIVIPKRGRLNALEVQEAETLKTALDSYIGRLTAVCNALSSNIDEIGHDEIAEAMNLTRNMATGSISYQSILEAKKRSVEAQTVAAVRSFFEWLDYYLEKKDLSEGRKRGFRVLVRILARYQEFVRQTDKQRRGFTLDIDTIDKETLEDFFDYMANEKQLSEDYKEIFAQLLTDYPVEFSPKHKNKTIEDRGHNIIVGRKKSLKGFFNWLNDQKITSNRPFDGITIGSEKYGRPFYLTLEERNVIANKDLSANKHLETQRDIFVFQSLIGCRVSDLLLMNDAKVIEGAIEYVPRKTKDKKPVTVRVPLNERAKALVEKYKGVDPQGRLFPFISSQKYNDAIKEILTVCEITRKVTVINSLTGEEEQRPINEIASSHMARRTFIGNIYKQVKDPNLIGALSGHTEGSKAFVRYRDIDEDIKKEIVSLID